MTWSSDPQSRHRRPNAPHRFREGAAPAEPDPPGEPDGDCTVCGAGPRFRAHQPLLWRFFHPLTTWR
jgi:hypothetical protein